MKKVKNGNQMKILITGATGKVGSRLAQYFLNQKEDIRLLVRDKNRAASLKEQGAEIIVGDLTNLEDLKKAVNGIDVVIHTAAAFRGVSDETQKSINLDATIHLAKVALEASVQRFIFASTTNVYLGNTLNRPATENDEPTGTATYPASKIAAEKGLHKLLDGTATELVITRFGLVYGDNDPHLSELAPYLTERHPEKLNSLVHHTDIDRALLQIVRTKDLKHDLYNIVDDSETSIADILSIENIAQERPTDNAYTKWESVASNHRLKEDFGFSFLYPSITDAKDANAL
ncbi:NAD(P)-dependent oxidoreductase [Lactococcus hircilactis]|uniref:NAD-dependent epimerase/dehydratase family protein n=1 Tax=Lactococcus hircilactis TaxID=1494462 RepID=UPI0031B60719